jgi:tRNA pseudouridine55 synthase
VAKRRPPTRHGVCVIDKPPGMTSHDVVNVARRTLGERRIGHAGTLDPSATGVLVIGVGSVTRALRFCTDAPKAYVGEVVFGTATSTLDADGAVVERRPSGALDLASVRAAAARFVGTIEQIPPRVSAVSIGGRRLHELAREGVEVERAPRPVTIHAFDVEDLGVDPGTGAPVARIRVRCSSGTYIRVLAVDLAAELGEIAHLRALRRTEAAGFTLDDATPLDAPVLLPPAAAARVLPCIEADDVLRSALAFGRMIPADDRFVGTGPWAVVDGDAYLAVVERRGADRIKPAVVLTGAG